MMEDLIDIHQTGTYVYKWNSFDILANLVEQGKSMSDKINENKKRQAEIDRLLIQLKEEKS
jgi:hypothetical protein